MVPHTPSCAQAHSQADLAGAHAAASTLLDAWRLLLFLGEPAKVAVVLHHSLEVLGEGKFSLLCWLISVLLLWLHSNDCQVCSCVSSALTIQGGPFLLPGMCSVHVLCLCLHGHLQNCEHFRSPLY